MAIISRPVRQWLERKFSFRIAAPVYGRHLLGIGKLKELKYKYFVLPEVFFRSRTQSFPEHKLFPPVRVELPWLNTHNLHLCHRSAYCFDSKLTLSSFLLFFFSSFLQLTSVGIAGLLARAGKSIRTQNNPRSRDCHLVSSSSQYPP
jgi:hypothetical protein